MRKRTAVRLFYIHMGEHMPATARFLEFQLVQHDAFGSLLRVVLGQVYGVVRDVRFELLGADLHRIVPIFVRKDLSAGKAFDWDDHRYDSTEYLYLTQFILVHGFIYQLGVRLVGRRRFVLHVAGSER